MLRSNTSQLSLCLSVVWIITRAAVAAGQEPAGFGERPTREIVLPEFSDAEISRLVATLDALLPAQAPPDGWGPAARLPLWEFVRRLQDGRLSPEQEHRVLRRLGDLEAAHPESAEVLSRARHAVSALTIGKEAPEIDGADLDGRPLQLSSYRGKVVVLTFGGAWCAICRADYPYERFLLELYGEWPFAILGVDSSATPDEARRGQVAHGLSYAVWWDGRPGPDERGPIAAAWNVLGWPTTYVLDAAGIIRYVDLRGEDLMKAVRQLLVEEQRRLLKAGSGAKDRPLPDSRE